MQIKTPRRRQHSYTQRLKGAPAAVFELLCPVREADWIEGWDPEWVQSQSGLAELDCVFATREAEQQAIWVVTRHEPLAGRVEMLKFLPEESVCHLTIQVLPEGEAGSSACISYCLTSLGPKGEAQLEAFDEAYYLGFMQAWEARMNHFLLTGERLRDPQD